jgi:hypothetical protein
MEASVRLRLPLLAANGKTAASPRVVERSFAWFSRDRRSTRNFERYARTVAAFVRLAMNGLMLKRLTKPSRCS